MSEYRLTDTSIVIRTADCAFIPDDPRNGDRAAYEAWLAAGNMPDPYEPPETPAPSFLARDFFALLTVDDFTSIQAAVAGNPALGLLWASLPAQGEAPIRTGQDRFLRGWAGVTQALGAPRAAEIAAALGIPD